MKVRREWIALGVVLLIGATALRAALPWVLKGFVNKNLHQLNSYDGHVDAVDVALWRGAYGLQNLVVVKKDAADNEPFFIVDHLRLAIQWRALLKGSVVGEAVFERPSLNLIQSDNAATTQLGTNNDWASTLEKLFPFKFNAIAIHQGI